MDANEREAGTALFVILSAAKNPVWFDSKWILRCAQNDNPVFNSRPFTFIRG